MLSCAVHGCKNIQLSIDTDTTIDYHPFPKNEICQNWVQACGSKDRPIDVETAHICSVHFDPNAYDTEVKIVDNNLCFIKSLKYYAVPTLNLPAATPEQLIIEDNLQGYTLVYAVSPSNSQDTNIEDVEFVTLPSNDETEHNLDKETDSAKDKYGHVKTHYDLHFIKSQNEVLKSQIQELEAEISTLEDDINSKINQYEKFDEECTKLKAEIADIKVKNATLTHHDQKEILAKVFSDAQIKMLFGKKKVTWSDDDMAVGYTIRELGNKRCYLYLVKNLNIPLPAFSSMKRWIGETKCVQRKRRVRKSTPTE